MPGDGSYATQIRLARSYLELCQQCVPIHQGFHQAWLSAAVCCRYDSESNKLMKYVRAHLFKILYWGLMQVSQSLSAARTKATMFVAQDKTLCERLSNVFTLAEISEVLAYPSGTVATDKAGVGCRYS